MIVTSVRLRLSPPTSRRVRAVGCVVIDRCIQIEHIHIIEKCDGIYIVAMPSKYESGKFHDIAHPITREARSEIDRSVLKEFSRVLDSERLTNAADHVKVSQ